MKLWSRRFVFILYLTSKEVMQIKQICELPHKIHKESTLPSREQNLFCPTLCCADNIRIGMNLCVYSMERISEPNLYSIYRLGNG